MTTQEQLLAEVEKFLTLSGMSAGAFGRRSVNDGKLVNRLRRGCGCTLETADRIRQFIIENTPGKTTRRTRKVCAAA